MRGVGAASLASSVALPGDVTAVDRSCPASRAVRPARWLLLAVVLAVLLILLLAVPAGRGGQTRLQAVVRPGRTAPASRSGSTFGLVEFVANVVMFVPLGALGALSRPRRVGR